MSKIELDKYYTDKTLSEDCVDHITSMLGCEFDRIIEPSAGGGSFIDAIKAKMKYNELLAYDIAPERDDIIKQDYLTVDLPYMEKSITIGNPPFGRANKLSVKFVIRSLTHSKYIAFIQPISQLNQNRTMKNTKLILSVDLGKMDYSGKPIHCCFNIYEKCEDSKNEHYDIPGVLEFRHIFRTGKFKHSDEILNYPWDFRVSAWGAIRLLTGDEQSNNEVVIRCDDLIKSWIYEKLKSCDYKALLNCVSSPNLPAWRLKKWLFEEYQKDNMIRK